MLKQVAAARNVRQAGTSQSKVGAAAASDKTC